MLSKEHCFKYKNARKTDIKMRGNKQIVEIKQKTLINYYSSHAYMLWYAILKSKYFKALCLVSLWNSKSVDYSLFSDF